MLSYNALLLFRLFKSKLLWKLSLDNESHKTLTRIWKDSRGMDLASPSLNQTRGLASDFKICMVLWSNRLVAVIGDFNSLRVNPSIWSNTLKQFVGKISYRQIVWVFNHLQGWCKGLSSKHIKEKYHRSNW